MNIDYYKLLGIHPGSNEHVIKDAYSKNIEELFYSKDKNKEYYNEQLELLNTVFDTLMDQDKRVIYDQNWLERKSSKYNFISSEKKPSIDYFIADKTLVESGEIIVVKWKANDCDQLILLPYGPVYLKGEREILVENLEGEFYKLKLLAENTINGLNASYDIAIKNKNYTNNQNVIMSSPY